MVLRVLQIGPGLLEHVIVSEVIIGAWHVVEKVEIRVAADVLLGVEVIYVDVDLPRHHFYFEEVRQVVFWLVAERERPLESHQVQIIVQT